MDNDHKFFSLRATKLALETRKSKVNSLKSLIDVSDISSLQIIDDQINWLDNMITATNLMIEASLKPEIPF